MRNFKAIVQYEGTRYQGWQKQDTTDNTIQGKLEKLLSRMAGVPTEVQGSGRTDAGVHSLGQTMNFRMETSLTPKALMDTMNSYLPEDIAIVSLTEASERFHSRLNATGKRYCYRVLNSTIPHIFERRYVYQVEEKLDIDAMRTAAAYLKGSHDFKAFTSTKRGKKSTVRRIDEINIEVVGDEIRFTFTGNGFLYHMVRIIVGTLLEVGKKKMKPEQMKEILLSENREQAGPLVPGQGLTLMEVFYE